MDLKLDLYVFYLIFSMAKTYKSNFYRDFYMIIMLEFNGKRHIKCSVYQGFIDRCGFGLNKKHIKRA